MGELKSFFQVIENKGWSIEEEGVNEYRLSQGSPHGQDFSIVVTGETEEDIIDSIYEAYDNYDVSEETYIWLDNTGHGTNGAPYHMRDVLADMEACEQMILDLYDELNRFVRYNELND